MGKGGGGLMRLMEFNNIVSVRTVSVCFRTRKCQCIDIVPVLWVCTLHATWCLIGIWVDSYSPISNIWIQYQMKCKVFLYYTTTWKCQPWNYTFSKTDLFQKYQINCRSKILRHDIFKTNDNSNKKTKKQINNDPRPLHILLKYFQ